MTVACLQVTVGPEAGTVHAVGSGIVIGRGHEAELRLSDPAVSRLHAAVRVEGRTLVVEDLGSANGTWVNGDRLRDPRRAGAGDSIVLGDTRLEIQIETEEGPLPRTEQATPDDPTVIEPSQPA
jgi:pSer/pThr/pTyr-binding forkhead associated (FHA) protein